MTTQANYDIVPINGGWLVKMVGDSVSEWHSSKGEAVRRARELGSAYGTWHVRVLAPNGVVEQELSSVEAAS